MGQLVHRGCEWFVRLEIGFQEVKVTGRLRTSFLIVINEAETGGSAAISPSRII